MKRAQQFLTTTLIISLVPFASGCSKIDLNKKPPSQGEEKKGPAVAVPSINGAWTMAFSFGEKVTKSEVNLQQEAGTFSGQGHELEGNKAFTISDGTITGKEVFFRKRYNSAPPDAIPVEYIGTIVDVDDKEYHGPHMSGEYTTLYQGNEVKGQWEAEMPSAYKTAPPPVVPARDPNKAPELSGKWKAAFQYNFKTIKSTMFIEQDGGKLTGHGVDTNTNEKFEIVSGSYNYPKLTLVRRYTKGKDAASSRTMAFKGEVSYVTDAHYQGPYMKGETQGGGSWEAEQVK